MSELELKQIIFRRYLGSLLSAFHDDLITVGEAWRSPETCALYAKEGKGVDHSCHQFRLAIDLNIMTPTGQLSTKKSDYAPLGEYWKELPMMSPPDIEVVTCWGGDFSSLCDFYHFSIEYNGVR